MSMNFGREQALLRQRLTAAGAPERAASRAAEFGDALQFLGADDAEVAAAASDLAAQYPQMGRAQMTAFVRTLWQSKVHELRAVGVELLALRAALLEPPDVPFLEGLLKDDAVEPVADRLASDVLGPLVGRNKKLWKDLQKLAKSANARLRRAAVRAAKAPVAADAAVFARFEDLAVPLLAEADALLQRAIDAVLVAAAQHDAELVRAFAEQHGRKLKLPKKKAAKAAAATIPAAPKQPAAAKKAMAKQAAEPRRAPTASKAKPKAAARKTAKKA